MYKCMTYFKLIHVAEACRTSSVSRKGNCLSQDDIARLIVCNEHKYACLWSMRVFEFGAHGPKPPIHIRMQISSPSAMQSVLMSAGGFKCTLYNTQQWDSTRVEQQCRRIASRQARAPQRSISWGASGVVGSSISPTIRTKAIARCDLRRTSVHC